ncbi:LacI family DNA-binding transcriptional regulator [Phytoactinopolyspora halotolerans]|uniref:LacI family transcriptional regulator n=1 Tax=Phytoactinopolyspora halotolerans TaxID=1981512 RepID=A0A6L9SAM7_9ACTN|nr:LacI family DNA-binding transcriptional regulator [Phytoactinopolyspora halotolerans]NEE01548.1 LacI family transcriptional regulator [Phytoactinopolyspora halotolerans]
MSTPTVYDVANHAGVSIATVSRVYRNPDTVRAETRDRVLAAARTLGYVPSGNARGLASRATGVLGLCFPDNLQYDEHREETQELGHEAHHDEADLMIYSDEVIRGMERAARERGYGLLIAATVAGDPASTVADVAGRVDGVAVLAGTVSTAELEVISRRLPVVMLAGPRENPALDHLDHVEVANFDGQLAMTRHLIVDHGLTKLAFVGGPPNSPDGEARFRGFQAAHLEAGLDIPAEPRIRAGLTTSSGRHAIGELLATLPERPQAVMFANDQMAVGALPELEHRGLRVPADIAVTGFDDISVSRLVRPALTTVRQPMQELGRHAVDLLLARVADRDRAPVSRLLQVSMVRRASCGCRVSHDHQPLNGS